MPYNRMTKPMGTPNRIQTTVRQYAGFTLLSRSQDCILKRLLALLHVAIARTCYNIPPPIYQRVHEPIGFLTSPHLDVNHLLHCFRFYRHTKPATTLGCIARTLAVASSMLLTKPPDAVTKPFGCPIMFLLGWSRSVLDPNLTGHPLRV